MASLHYINNKNIEKIDCVYETLQRIIGQKICIKIFLHLPRSFSLSLKVPLIKGLSQYSYIYLNTKNITSKKFFFFHFVPNSIILLLAATCRILQTLIHLTKN